MTDGEAAVRKCKRTYVEWLALVMASEASEKHEKAKRIREALQRAKRKEEQHGN